MIGTAKQNGSQVDVYDENGSWKFSRNGELIGFTGTTVSLKNGSQVDVYDENGSWKFSR